MKPAPNYFQSISSGYNSLFSASAIKLSDEDSNVHKKKNIAKFLD